VASWRLSIMEKLPPVRGSLALASSPIVRNQVFREKERSRPGGASSNVADLDPGARRRAWSRAGSGLRHSVLVSAGMGTCLGALGILCVAFTGRHHHIAAVAWVEAALAVSSAVGGLAYGAFRWRASGQTRLVVLASGIGLSVALAGQSPGIYILIAVIAVVGLFVSPILITAYLTAEEAAAPGTRTEGGTWVNTAHNLGNSAGTAGIGLLVDRFPLPACFAAAALTALLPAIAVAIGKKKRPVVVTAPERGDEWICGSSAARMARANVDAHGASGLGGSDGGVGKFGGGAS
jgi:MFS family permease